MARSRPRLEYAPTALGAFVDPFAATVRMPALAGPATLRAVAAPVPQTRPAAPGTAQEPRRALAPATAARQETAPGTPYDLAAGEATSEGYYRAVAALAEDVQAEGLLRLQGTILGFLGALHRRQPQADRPGREALVELLTLGVLFRAYAARVERLPGWARRLLLGLAWLRTRAPWLRGPVDALRGRLLGRFCGTDAVAPVPLPTRERLRGLVGWLAATGDYGAEARRLGEWSTWLATLPAPEAEATLAAILTLAGWFEARAAARLAPYTARVASYGLSQREPHRHQEDLLLVTRGRSEVHLNLVGAELLNRALRARFAATARRLVLLPGCLRARPEGACRATADAFGQRCARCDAQCRVQEIEAVATEVGAEVRLLTHASQLAAASALRWEAKEARETGVALGVVGVSCAGHLLAGGWLTRDLGLPAQCVVLDRATCARHWHPEGPPTALNLDELRRRLAA